MAQQARRLVDRLVGFQVSPMLWQQIKGYKGLSAGRVQSAALKIIYDRQEQIDQFQIQEYWTISGFFRKGEGVSFRTALTHLNGIDLKERPIRTKSEAEHIKNRLVNMRFMVGELKFEQRGYSAPLPFITTTLMQAASSKLRFSSKKTMSVAQELFEDGLITYMRTDSERVSPEFQQETYNWIAGRWGKDYVPESDSSYKTSATSQDAHECIRPTDIRKEPGASGDLSKDQALLYELIHTHFVKSHMAAALHDERTVKIHGSDDKRQATFHGFSSRIVFPGWRVLHRCEENYEPGVEGLLDGDAVMPEEFIGEPHTTKPPNQFTEATLIKTMEKLGIGRPSTYATIIETLMAKEYVVQVQEKLVITDIGKLVIDVLSELFPNILDVEFTSEMEKALDQIGQGELNWECVVGSLQQEIESATRRK